MDFKKETKLVELAGGDSDCFESQKNEFFDFEKIFQKMLFLERER